MTKIHRELKQGKSHSLIALCIDKRIILTAVNYTCNSELNRKYYNRKPFEIMFIFLITLILLENLVVANPARLLIRPPFLIYEEPYLVGYDAV
jgi:hypothetical protein